MFQSEKMNKDHEKLKKALKNTSCPEADFSVHKKELRVVIGMVTFNQKKPWWDVSFPRVAAATVITVGIVVGVFVVGPMSPLSKSKVLANAEAAHRRRGQNAQFYYAKEKMTAFMPKKENTSFLEMHEDLRSGDVDTRVYDVEGKRMDERAIISEHLYVCVECVQEKIFAHSLSGDLIFAGALEKDEPVPYVSENIFDKIWSLQSNPGKVSRALLFEELRKNTDISYTGKTKWNNIPVEKIELVEHDNGVNFKTAFYFEEKTFKFKGSDDFISKKNEYKKVGSREILDETYTNETFIIDTSQLQQTVFE